MQRSKNTTAFVLSLVGGVLMIVNGFMSVIMLTSFGVNFGFMGGMMSSFAGMMGGFGFPFGLMAGLMMVSIIAGIVVLIGALMLNTRPSERLGWGIIILIFSIISFVGIGGFVVGAILGITGGALAIS